MDCLYARDDEKLHLTDAKNQGTGNSHNKKVLYEPEGMDRCKQYVCSQRKAILVVSVMMIFIVTVAIIASLARPMAKECPEKLNTTAKTEKPKQNFIATNGKPFPWKDIRLPKTVLPVSYALQMHPNLATFLFKGSVEIIVQPVEKTNFIVLHIKNLNITKLELTLSRSPQTNVKITEYLEYKGHEQIYVKLESNLNADTNYTLKMSFDGELSSHLAGFYKSSYKTSAGETVWLATTHFEATDARAAFPCFDEPQMKAFFSMKMTRDSDHISLFNTAKVKEVSKTNGLVEDEFERSVKMSTYLVAFVVCDYKNLSATTTSNVKVSVYAPPELIEQARYALESAVSILEYYEEFFGVKYPMPKQDLIAIPDFAAGAMENWGLITYRMTALLYDPNVSSASNKQWVAVVVAHELAHQWFGNLVTMEWWNDLWLNEGFASFVEYLGTDHKEPDWDMLDQFISGTLVAALHSDSLSSSHPISVTVSDPAEIAQIFDHISYEKGSSIIRMLESFITREVLKTGLHHYLDKHQFSNAETTDLWESFSLAAKNKQMNINVKEIMDTWTLQMGYPLVKLSQNGNRITATQERFLLNPRGYHSTEFDSPFDYKWNVPLTYITDQDSITPHLEWMKMGSVSFDIPDGAKWVKFNTKMTGFYRVHYEDAQWKNLTQQMHQDHLVFNIADRANLLDDSFQLAQAGHMDIVNALNLTTYLLKEKEYVPWNVALENLQYIGQMLEEKPTHKYYAKYVKHLIEPRLKELGWAENGPQLTKYLRSSLLSMGVKLNHEKTVKVALEKYRTWMTTGEKLPVDIKNVIYHAGIQYGGEAEWQYAWDAYKNTSVPSEKKKLMYALSATTDALRLNRYLYLSLDENEIRKGDKIVVVSSIAANPAWIFLYLYLSLDENEIRKGDTIVVISSIASNPAGRVLAWRFVKQHWDHFAETYGKGSFDMPTLILRTTSKFTSQYDYDEVKSFYKTHDTGSGTRAVSQVLESIEMNIDWLKTNEHKCVQWLKEICAKIDNKTF